MNLTEFNALKPGDRIENAMSGSSGEVVEADSKGVTVRWHMLPWRPGQDNGVLRHYSRFSTIWFHWSKVETHTLTVDEVADVRRGGPHEVG